MIITCPGRRAVSFWAFCLIIFIASLQTFAQTPIPSPAASPDPQATPTPATTSSKESLEKKFFWNILDDQRGIWTFPFRLNRGDAKWGIPLMISSAALFATDRHTSGSLVSHGDNLSRLRISNDVSQLGTAYTTGGIAAGFYLVGLSMHNARARETGVLAAEALVDGGIVVQALKLASQRQRPPTDNSSGEFFDGGSSFPSGHAISAWSVATVIAEEYGQHRPLVRFGVYGLATAVSISRYTGRNHFLSDALLGSAMGYGIGRYVYHKHHDQALDSPHAKQTSSLFHSRLFPDIAPLYNARARTYGARMAWEF
jgi:membrane-associated phospholipid phosphatase